MCSCASIWLSPIAVNCAYKSSSSPHLIEILKAKLSSYYINLTHCHWAQARDYSRSQWKLFLSLVISDINKNAKIATYILL